MIPQLNAPVQQTTPQDSALDQYLNEELGSSLMEGETSEDGMPFTPQAQLDPSMMLAAFNPKNLGTAASEVAGKLAGKEGEVAGKEAAAMPNLNPFAESVDAPAAMGDDIQPSQDAVINAVKTAPDPNALIGRQAPSNLNLDHFNDPADKQLIDLVAKANGGYKDIAGRQPQTHKQTIEKAQSKATLEKLLNKKVNDKWQPEELVGMYKIMEAQSQNLRDLGKRITEVTDAGGEPDGELLAQFQAATQRFRATQATASGAASEAGRLLNALQAISKSGSSTEYYRNVANAIEGGGGKDTIIQRARMFSNDPDLQQANKIVEATWNEKAWKGMMQVRYNMMLSSVRTHGANIAGSTITGVIESFPRKAAASTWSMMEYYTRELIPNMKKLEPNERVRFFSELPSELAGIRTGAIEGLKLAGRIATGSELQSGGSKWFNEIGVRYDPAGVDSGTLAKIGTTPTRMLEAEDAFFKNVYFTQKINQLAFRKTAGLENQDEAYKQLVDFPTEEMVKEAKLYSERLTLTNDPNIYSRSLGGLATQFADYSATQGALPKGIKILVPFVKTPANAMGYAFDIVGLGRRNVHYEESYRIFKEGTPEQRAELMGNMMASAGMWALLYQTWENGQLTGVAPADSGMRRSMEAAGWQENSIKIGDKYYSLNRADPLGTAISMMAGGFDSVADANNKDPFGTFMATVLSVSEIIKDRSMLVGLTDFISLIDGGTPKALQDMFASNAASFVTPNIVRDAREMSDPLRRDVSFDQTEFLDGAFNRFLKTIENAYPVSSRKLPPAVDVNGDYIYNGGNMYWRGLVPVRVSDIQKQDLVALEYVANAIPVTRPSHIFRIAGTQAQINVLQLDDQQGWLYHEYQKMVGKARHDLVTEFMNSAEGKQLAADGDFGAGSTTDDVLRILVSKGLKVGQYEFLKYIEGMKQYQPMSGGEVAGDPVDIVLPYSEEDAVLITEALTRGIEGDSESVGNMRLKILEASKVYPMPTQRKAKGLTYEQQNIIKQESTGEISF